MQCYFHLANGRQQIPDPDGIEVADLDQAREHALEAVKEACGEDEAAASRWLGWRLEVADAGGVVLFSISLSGSALNCLTRILARPLELDPRQVISSPSRVVH